MIFYAAQAFYFFLPAYAANMAPVFARVLGLPFDKAVSVRFFGENKTWRGFVSGYFFALFILYMQKLIFIQQSSLAAEISVLDYGNISIWLFAVAFGIGAITGDLVKSFFKRGIGKNPGDPWFPFDQLDFVLGSILFLYPLYKMDFRLILVIIVITPILHFLTNIAGYFLGLKPVWW